MSFFQKIFEGFGSFFARFFGGGPGGGAPGDIGLYYYVRCIKCNEVIKVRVNPNNDLSARDDGSGYFSRKMIVGQRCYNRIEAEFEFGGNRRFKTAEISGGTLVDKKAFLADQAEQQAKATDAQKT